MAKVNFETLLAVSDWFNFAKDEMLKAKKQGTLDKALWSYAIDFASVMKDYPGRVDIEAFAAAIYHVILRWEADRNATDQGNPDEPAVTLN